MLTASVFSFEQSENNHGFDFQFFFPLRFSDGLPLIDLLESSRMLETPMRLPRVMLLSRKKEPVDCESRSEVESVEEVGGEPVIKVLKEMDPFRSWFLANPITLAFIGCSSPSGHPSSC